MTSHIADSVKYWTGYHPQHPRGRGRCDCMYLLRAECPTEPRFRMFDAEYAKPEFNREPELQFYSAALNPSQKAAIRFGLASKVRHGL